MGIGEIKIGSLPSGGVIQTVDAIPVARGDSTYKVTVGNMASQSSNAISVSGGTINGTNISAATNKTSFFGPVFNAFKYGITDDNANASANSAALVTLFNDVKAAGGGRVIFPRITSGKYLFSESWNMAGMQNMQVLGGDRAVEIIFTNNGSGYVAHNLLPVGIKMVGTGTAQSGPHSIYFDYFTLRGPKYGVAALGTECSCIVFGENVVEDGNHSAGEWCQYGIVFVDSINCGCYGTMFGPHHRFNLYFGYNDGLWPGLSSEATYNDSPIYSFLKHTGSNFACICDAGTSAFGCSDLGGCTKNGDHSHYSYIAGHGRTIDIHDNWTEGCYSPIWSTRTYSGTIPTSGPTITGVDEAIPVTAVLEDGYCHNINTYSNHWGNILSEGTYDGFTGTSVVRDNLLGCSGGCTGIVKNQGGPLIYSRSQVLSGSITNPSSSVGLITFDGIDGAGRQWCDDVNVASTTSYMGSGSAFPLTMKRMFFLTGGTSNYPVIKLPLYYAGPVRLKMYKTQGAGGGYVAMREAEMLFAINSDGHMAALGGRYVDAFNKDGNYYTTPSLGVSYGLIKETDGTRGPAIYIGIIGNAAVDGTLAEIELNGAFNYAYGEKVPTATVTDYNTASAAITAAGAAGVAFTTLSEDRPFYAGNVLAAKIKTATSAVNYPTLIPSATTAAVVFGVEGSDTNIDINLTPKGTGKVNATTFVGSLTGSCTGNAATVTTNANLTGDVTSVGNATTVSKIAGVTVGTPTGSGNVVFSASPTLTGTVSGAAASWSGNDTALAFVPTAGGTAPGCGVFSNNANILSLATNSTERWQINASGHLIPVSNTAYDIGKSTYKPNNIFAAVFNTTAGSVGTPSVVFNNSAGLNTGFYSGTADTIGFVSSGAEKARIDTGGNICIGTTSNGSGAGCIAMHNAATVPTVNPTLGGVLYVDSGALKYRGSSGTVTTIANA